MATQSREPTAEAELERGLPGQIEVHSIDWIPDTERHGKTWQQTMLWFLGNFNVADQVLLASGLNGAFGDRRGQPGGVR